MAPKRRPPRTADPGPQGDEALRSQRAAADAQMFQSATDRKDRSRSGHESGSPQPEDAAPAVGKTGRGAKAERPSPVSDRKEAEKKLVEVTRTSKPPAETPRAPAHRGKPRAAA